MRDRSNIKTIRCDCGCNSRVDVIADDDIIEICFLSDYLGKENSKLRILYNVIKDRETYYSGIVLKREEAIKFFKDCIQLLEG